MEIKEIRVLRGPNYWSNHRTNLIEMKLDIGLYEDRPTNLIPGFTDRLITLLPSLESHRCSLGKKGGFIKRMQEGTWLGHVIEHVALELQTLAGMDTGFGRTRSTEKRGVYCVVFSYLLENAGIYAGKAAVKLVQAIATESDYSLSLDIETLQSILYREGYGPSTQSIVTEAEKRDIPVTRLDEESLVMFGQGCNQRIIRATVADSTANIAVDIAGDKYETKRILRDNYIPVAQGCTISNQIDLLAAIEEIGYPLVIKPTDGNHGRGITTGITNMETAISGLMSAKRVSERVIVEKHIEGYDYRFLVINYKLVAAAKRTPATVIGDGKSTVRTLIDAANRDPRRGDGHEKPLTAIKVDKSTQSILAANKLSLSSVLQKGHILRLKDTANLSSGGTAEDVTDLVHPENKFMAERIARLVGLDICGIDIVAKDVASPIANGNGTVLEVNAAPGFRMHTHPSDGKARDIGGAVLDMLYPNTRKARVPLVAVTGTNGKTTTTRLIAHLGKCAGYVPGFTCTDGIYIDGNIITEGDCSGPISAAAVLRDPLVDLAVLECARGGILRSGLGFDHCNVSVVTNVSEDHLGISGIDTLEKLAKVKSVVPRSTFVDGCAVLNADDDLVFAMRTQLSCRIALFSTDQESSKIREHLNNNGTAAVADDKNFILYRGTKAVMVIPITKVPITLNGKAGCMIKNVMAALLAADALGIPKQAIELGLRSFDATPEMLPGRMNIFSFDKFKVIVDYAHNTGGYQELKEYLQKDDSKFKTGIIAATGDRRDEDIILLGVYASQIFDEIIIRHDKDGRGRTNDNITKLLFKGIRKVSLNKPVRMISNEIEALQYAIDNAGEDNLVFISSDDIKNTIDYLKERLKNKDLVGYES